MDEGERPTPGGPRQGSEPPQAVPPEPPPLVAWTPEPAPAESLGADRPQTPAQRTVEVIAWVVGIAAVLFFGRVFAALGASEEVSAEEWGRITGTIVGALLIAVGVRWLLVKAGRARRVLSPWIPVIATLILLVGLFSRAGGGSG